MFLTWLSTSPVTSTMLKKSFLPFLLALPLLSWPGEKWEFAIMSHQLSSSAREEEARRHDKPIVHELV